jgi:hypothetical protein
MGRTVMTRQDTQLIEALSERLCELHDGRLSMVGFRNWFRALRWDTERGFNRPEVAPLGWAIETSLFEFDDFPHEYTVADLKTAIQSTMQRQAVTPWR